MFYQNIMRYIHMITKKDNIKNFNYILARKFNPEIN